ncbi:MAG: recombination regulator RecX [Treponema sp.]|nr:recombination regulator RecX [Treponema sp.]
MTIVSVKTGADWELRVAGLSDGSSLSFRVCYLSPDLVDTSLCTHESADTIEGRELSPDEVASLRFAAACLDAEKAALQLIARAEQTVFGLGQKLAKRGHDSACSKTVIARLCGQGLLDDFRYARLWLDSRVSRGGSSPMRLLAALRAKGIGREDAESAMREALDDEAEQRLLERFAQKRQGGKYGTDLRHMEDSARRSLKYLLKSEGFSSQAIGRLFED